MPMYKLIAYSDNYSKRLIRLWHYYKDEPALDANDAISNFPVDGNNNISFKIKTKIADVIGNDGTKI